MSATADFEQALAALLLAEHERRRVLRPDGSIEYPDETGGSGCTFSDELIAALKPQAEADDER